MQTVVIIGGGHGGAEAAANLRIKGWDGEIVLISSEPNLPYQRPPLSKAYFKGEMDFSKLEIRDAAFYKQANITLHLGQSVESIDRDGQQVVLGNGKIIGYSKLILATGARARHLKIDGSDLPNIHSLRNKQDVDNIKKQLAPGKKLLIIGAGYIGLETAASAIKQGVEVTVLEAQERVLARVSSPPVSEFYEKLHSDNGVSIRLSARLNGFYSNSLGTYAIVNDKEEIPFDCALVGIGVIPNVELAKDASLPCDNGILVDTLARTADPDIYAIGDCSNHPSIIYDRRIRLESVPNAMSQAKTVAMAICGEENPYDQLPWFWSDQYDVKLQTAGLLTGYDTALIRGSQTDKKFSVFYLRQGCLIAVDAINSPADFMLAKKLISAKAHPDTDKLIDSQSPLKDLLTHSVPSST